MSRSRRWRIPSTLLWVVTRSARRQWQRASSNPRVLSGCQTEVPAGRQPRRSGRITAILHAVALLDSPSVGGSARPRATIGGHGLQPVNRQRARRAHPLYGVAEAGGEAGLETDKGPEGDRGFVAGAVKPAPREGRSRECWDRPPRSWRLIFPRRSRGEGRRRCCDRLLAPTHFFLMWPTSYPQRRRRRSPNRSDFIHPDDD